MSKSKYIFCTSFFVILSLYKVCGQVDEKLGSWYIYNGSYYVDPEIELFFESQVRLYKPLSDVEEFFLRPMANYHFSSMIFAGLGYSYGNSWSYAENKDDKEGITENRLILQAGINHNISRTKIQHRYRFEQRWFKSGNRHRFRYRLQVTIPLNGNVIEKGTYYINLYDEVFINSKPDLAFDQNRIYIAGGYQFNNNLNFQIGYLFQSRPASNYNRLQFFLTHKLNIYK